MLLIGRSLRRPVIGCGGHTVFPSQGGSFIKPNKLPVVRLSPIAAAVSSGTRAGLACPTHASRMSVNAALARRLWSSSRRDTERAAAATSAVRGRGPPPPPERGCSSTSNNNNNNSSSGSSPQRPRAPPPSEPTLARCSPGKKRPEGRCFSSTTTAATMDPKAYLWARYNDTRRLVHDLIPPGACNLLNAATIYANNEVSLGEVDIYGFDYDYTLALYSNSLNAMIYEQARSFLIEHFKYPEGIGKYDYIPNFAARGLHYDIEKGLLMKIDAFHYIEAGTVYRGLSPVPDDVVLQHYGGTHHVPLEQDSGFYGKGPKVKQFMDVFSIPEMTLLAVANDYFITHNIDFDPVHLFKDVSEAIGMVHLRGYMYKWIMQDMDKFILCKEETRAVLERLVNKGKKLFLITNSPYSFVNKGMIHMVGNNWRDFFNVIIVQADKPHFFTDCMKPFRRLDGNGDLRWDKISSLDRGQVYKQGNLFDFLRLTGWRGSKVLYFGDHLYSDLADLMLRHGWRTGAIVPELEHETKVVSTKQYSQNLTWLQALTGLLERLQTFQDPSSRQILQEWQKEREELRVMTKNLFNPQFGSIFRTCHNPTYFSRRLCRFSDVYMASLGCLLNYDLSYTFYPRRTPLQHEAPLWMDQLCTGCMKTPFLEEMSHIR